MPSVWGKSCRCHASERHGRVGGWAVWPLHLKNRSRNGWLTVYICFAIHCNPWNICATKLCSQSKEECHLIKLCPLVIQTCPEPSLGRVALNDYVHREVMIEEGDYECWVQSPEVSASGWLLALHWWANLDITYSITDPSSWSQSPGQRCAACKASHSLWPCSSK